LQRSIKEDGNSELVQSLYAFWLLETAAYKAFYLSKRYPDVNVYWTASDLMAIGVEQALKQRALVQGKDFLTGGVDWSLGGLDAVKQGKISTSVGGHFMDGAWALIMLYDHFNGKPLNRQNLSLHQAPMSLISSTEIDLLLPRLRSHKWDEINFRARSKVLNKDLKKYDFSPTSVLQELKKQSKH
jgi:ABC-type sugar transport system substrate-binding protein